MLRLRVRKLIIQIVTLFIKFLDFKNNVNKIILFSNPPEQNFLDL